MGATFEFEIPHSILSSESSYGVSYVFFAVCRGSLQPAPQKKKTVPLRCVDAAGRELELADFNAGYATVHTVAGVDNTLPRLQGLKLDGELVAEGTCDADADCAALDGDQLQYGCADGQCLPLVPSCSPDCPIIELQPLVDAASFEPNPFTPELPTEVVWVKLYAHIPILEDRHAYYVEGLLEGDRRRIDVRVPDTADGPRVVPTWFVVSDNRGGINWRSWELLLR